MQQVASANLCQISPEYASLLLSGSEAGDALAVKGETPRTTYYGLDNRG